MKQTMLEFEVRDYETDYVRVWGKRLVKQAMLEFEVRDYETDYVRVWGKRLVKQTMLEFKTGIDWHEEDAAGKNIKKEHF